MDQKSRINRLQIAIILVVGLVNLWQGEIVAYNSGFGWDGVIYGRIAGNFEQIVPWGLGAYRLQRVVPSAVVHYGLQVLQVPLNGGNLLAAFRVYDLVLLVLAVCVLGLITDSLAFSAKSKWLAFIFLFGNHALLKQYFYFPVSTDQTAFALGMLMLYFFLTDNAPGLLTVSLVGAFTWPTLLIMGLVLFVLPKSHNTGNHHNSRGQSMVLAAVIGIVLLLAVLNVYYVKRLEPVNDTVQVADSLIFPSVVVVLAYVFLGSRAILSQGYLYNISEIGKTLVGLRLDRVAIALVAWEFVRCGVSAVSIDRGSIALESSLFDLIVLSSIARPAIFAVAHVVYFGPVVLFATFLWKTFARIIGQYGIGLVIFVLMNFSLSIDSESRSLINFLPFLVVFTVKATEELGWPSSYYWIIGLVTFLSSKVWLPMNNQPLTGSLLDFPLQYIFMNLGPWMSNQMYIIQGAVVTLIAILFYFLMFRPQRNDSQL